MGSRRRRPQLVEEDAGSTMGKRIGEVRFGLLGVEEMRRLAEVECCNRELYAMPGRDFARFGCLDGRLGAASKTSVCETCGRKMEKCAGHFGVVRLELPVFHVGYLKHVVALLQCVCKKCSRILAKDRESLLRKLSRHRAGSADDAVRRAQLFKRVVEKCKNVSSCPRCESHNGAVKKVGLRIVHRMEDGETTENLNPLDVRRILSGISEEDCDLLWTKRPQDMVLCALPVPPSPIRPSVAVEAPGGSGSNEDDLTVKLQEIVDVNAALRQAIRKGGSTKMVLDAWQFLQLQVGLYVNGELKTIERPNIRGLCQRLKGKAGRFRGNLSGKRVDFSARTVISPDPNLGVDQVGVPVHVAKTMTYPERATALNIEKLRMLIRNGPKTFPGANYVESAGDFKKSLAYGDRNRVAAELKVGDVVERHMQDGDLVLFNRQPSLHKLSIMCHTVKVMQWRTFRFNECVCAPYNADFDGDEMNMHLPQTEEARAEAQELMSSKRNVCTPRNGEPLIAATQDFITSSFVMTTKDTFFHREQVCALAAYFGDAMESVDIGSPAILKPRKLWTGKQLFSIILSNNEKKPSSSKISLELAERNYSGSGKDMCSNDGYVVVRRSKLLCGAVAKKTIGDGSKRGLVFSLHRDHGADAAARFLNRLAKMASRYLGYHAGFSIGIDDVAPTTSISSLKASLVEAGDREAKNLIETFVNDQLPLKPGCDARQSLEAELTGLLGSVREKAGKNLMSTLPPQNAARVMATCGAKGSALNISQMIACLGQQAVDGKRIADGFVNRTLPHFEQRALTPDAKGFVSASFFDGLGATEFFFHTMGGREGLVDTAVKTAQTGYMARRLMKALEDLSMRYDGTVRNSENVIVQLSYGDDGLDPATMEANDRPVDLDRLLVRVQAGDYDDDKKRASNNKSKEEKEDDDELVSPSDLVATVTDLLASSSSGEAGGGGGKFLRDVQEYFGGLAAERASLEGLEHPERVPFLTKRQVAKMCQVASEKLGRSKVEPGEAVGAVGAQCISEPGTQMTLKTFHFAGVASMNVTLGVPRLTEIINAAKSISTPIIAAKLLNPNQESSARVVKARLEATTLGEICKSIQEVFAPNEPPYVLVELDRHLVAELFLDVTAMSAREAVLNAAQGVAASRYSPAPRCPPVLRALKPEHVLLNPNHVDAFRVVLPPVVNTTKVGAYYSATKKQRATDSLHNREGADDPTYFALQALKAALPKVVVSGVHSVGRAVVNRNENDGSFDLLVEGYGLEHVMTSVGVDAAQTTSNHVAEIEATLGVEAARSTIAHEISYIMQAYGIGIDRRHLALLSDVMTFKGVVLGITRFGVSKMRESVLMLASFERTTDHLFDAAVHARTDKIVGVSECIIMGIPIPLGTGGFKLLKDDDNDDSSASPKSYKTKKQRRSLVMDDEDD